MAAIDHKYLVHPTTDEVFSWRVLDTTTNQIVSRHRKLHLALDKAEQLNVEFAATALPREVPEEVPRCGYQDKRYELACPAPPRHRHRNRLDLLCDAL